MKFTEHDAAIMLDKQKRYYFTGITKSADFRKDRLLRLKESIKIYEADILQALWKDLRKSEFEAYVTEVGFVLDSIDHTVRQLDEWMKPEPVKTPIHLQPAKSFIVREPYGSVLIIAPFNYPFQLVIEPLIGAIAGGNCAIVKPSEMAVHTTAVIRKMLSETFEPEYVRVVEGEKEVTSALIHAPFDYIFFTGSVQVGKIIMRAASERLTPLTLELGGKSPAIVDQTANLQRAAERIAWGKFTNAGQTCVAPDYVFVHHSVKDKFLKKLSQTIEDFYGQDIQSSPDFVRIINDRHFDRLSNILQREQDNIAFGGRTDRSDLFVEPTILDGINWDNPSMEDEIFGPILPIMTYHNLGEIVHQIRQRPKPLAAYMFTENQKAEQFFLQELPFGGGCINDTIAHVGNLNLPFGGVGTSGMNAYHGKYSFESFTHAKSIMKKNTSIPFKIAYPPYKNKIKLVRSMLN